MKYCALCCIAKNEDLFLKEWVNYHSLIGFENFYIYDNASVEPIANLMQGWADESEVTVVRNDIEVDQFRAYNHCLENFGHHNRWIAFLDLDEFIRLGTPGENSGGNWNSFADIRVFLSAYEPYAAVGLNWRMFSSSGHESTPDGPVIGNYTHCIGDDVHIKSVVQPAKITGCAGPHSFYPKRGEYAVNSNRFPISPGFPFTIPVTKDVAVNHYFYKSRECFGAKIAKGNPCNIERRMAEFDEHLHLPVTRDERLLPFAARVSAIASGRKKSAIEPKSIYGQPMATDSKSHIASARWFMDQSGGLHNNIRHCLLHLAYAGLYAEAKQDVLALMEIWNLRGHMARVLGNMELAEFCVAESLKLGSDRGAYLELAEILLSKGAVAESGAVIEMIRHYEAESAESNTRK